MRAVILMVLVAMSFSSCKKEKDPVVITEEPVFRIVGTVNGSPVNLTAGIDDYVMYTDYNYDSGTSVFEFNGSLRKYNCASCANSLNIKLRNYRQTPSTESIIPDSAFTYDYYSITSTTVPSTSYLLQFSSQLNGMLQQGKWIFGDGSIPVVAANTQHVYSHPGEYTVGFIALYNNGCSDTLYNTFRFGIKGSSCHANFVPDIFGDSITLSDFSMGVAPLNYFIDFGDGITSNQWEPYHIYAAAGVYKIVLRITDAENNISEFSRKVFVLPTNECMASMTFPQLTPLPNTMSLSTVSIEYTNTNGTVFSSTNSPSGSDGFFQITGTEDYPDNANGDKVKKISMRFSCRLYNALQTEYVDMAVSDGVFAVAYK